MKLIICAPALDVEVERMIEGASPAAGKFINNMLLAGREMGANVIFAVYLTYQVISDFHSEIASHYEGDNFLVFKDKTIIASVIGYQRKVLELVDSETCVIFYNMAYYYIGLCKKIERRGGKCLLLLADHTPAKEESNIAKKILARLCEREFRIFHRIVTLAKQPNIRMNRSVKHNILYGGIKNSDYINFKVPKFQDSFVNVMYAGLLSDVTGVDILLEMITKNKDKNVRFIISGKGYLENIVKTVAQNDDRIVYLGFVDQVEYLEWLKKANILINPRNMRLDQNKNNFPSKILDYLATGRIILSTRFPGNEDFLNNIIFYDGTAGDLQRKLDYVKSNYRDLSNIYFTANRELAKQYDWNIQMKKVTDMFN